MSAIPEPHGLGRGEAVRPTAPAIDAVDVFDLTAHLEARGQGVAAARERGFATQFERAATLLDPGAAAGRAARPRRADVLARVFASLQRVLVLMAGVAVCLAGSPAGTSGGGILVAGIVGWLVGQAVSAAAWDGLARMSPRSAAGGVLTVWAVAAPPVVAGCALTGAWPVALWAAWAASASALIVLRPGGRVALPVGVAGAACAVTPLVRPEWGVAVAVTVVAGVAAAAVWAVAGLGPVRTAHGRLARVVGIATVQAAATIGVLMVVLAASAESWRGAIAVGGLVAGAVCDPALEASMLVVATITSRASDWRSGRRVTAAVGGAAVVVVALCAAAVTPFLAAGATTAAQGTIVAAVVAIASLTAASGMLMRVGDGGGAAGLWLGALAVLAAFGAAHLAAVDAGLAMAGAAAIVMAVGCAISAAAVGRPAWLG